MRGLGVVGAVAAAAAMTALVVVRCKAKDAGPRLKLDGGIAPREIDAAPHVADAAAAVAPAYAIQIAVGEHTSCAALSDGGVRCWGDNAQVTTSVRGAKQVVIGDAHACARLDDGSVTCWGKIGFTPGAKAVLTAPTAVPGVTGVKTLFAVGGATCATDSVGAMVCWGDVDAAGRPGSAGARRTPTGVRGVRNVVGMTKEGNGVMEEDGTVWTWGEGKKEKEWGRTGIEGAVEVEEREGIVCGIRGDGSVACACTSTCTSTCTSPSPSPGARTKATTSTSTSTKTSTNRSSTKKTGDAKKTTAKDAGLFVLPLPAAKHLAFDAGLCVVGRDGRVACLDACKATAMGLAKVESVTGSCALLSDGGVKCWKGDVGARTTVAIKGAEHVSALAGAGDRACALGENGGVACWTGTNAAAAIDLSK